jgi:hypothetical protein
METMAMKDAAKSAAADQNRRLVTIKVVHTAIWAFLVGCILALPFAAWLGSFRAAAFLTVVILLECCVLAANGGRCPLTDLAAKYTSDRASDFDIYMPVWLARHNKTVFRSLFVVNELIVLLAWARTR